MAVVFCEEWRGETFASSDFGGLALRCEVTYSPEYSEDINVSCLMGRPMGKGAPRRHEWMASAIPRAIAAVEAMSAPPSAKCKALCELRDALRRCKSERD